MDLGSAVWLLAKLICVRAVTLTLVVRGVFRG